MRERGGVITSALLMRISRQVSLLRTNELRFGRIRPKNRVETHKVNSSSDFDRLQAREIHWYDKQVRACLVGLYFELVGSFAELVSQTTGDVDPGLGIVLKKDSGSFLHIEDHEISQRSDGVDKSSTADHQKKVYEFNSGAKKWSRTQHLDQ